MNKITAIALTSLLATGAAMADSATTRELLRQSQTAAQSTTTRSAVIAELQRARQAGELNGLYREVDLRPASTASTTTRAAVLAELLAARASGELAVLNSNNPSYAQLAALRGGKSAGGELLAGQPATAR
ncbi:DUF4148 domain-containing protein [Paucibacter sp. M5-1]|uniref:DUF4148 domain-containing protein n=1 Tax=Paucibacter sp. M5-1 TaxID=3015998 RepID=UPI0022B93475|nr:DUF4148 domain-containing protein [Paucibacter sp. M5-1]MCZ7881953.1 hypothetical protein [Paucibacter sp. M5-1]